MATAQHTNTNTEGYLELLRDFLAAELSVLIVKTARGLYKNQVIYYLNCNYGRRYLYYDIQVASLVVENSGFSTDHIARGTTSWLNETIETS